MGQDCNYQIGYDKIGEKEGKKSIYIIIKISAWTWIGIPTISRFVDISFP
jgi:hypothetical protein